MDATLEQCARILRGHYGEQLADIILYGSAARGTETAESDLDLLVVLRPPFEYFRELRAIVDLLYPVQMEADRLISARPAPLDEFERGSIPLYRTVRTEGVRIAG